MGRSTQQNRKLKLVASEAAPESVEEQPVPLASHLEDLRNLLLRSLGAMTLALFFTFSECDRILEFLQKPLLRYLPADQQFLYFTGIADKFVVSLQVSVIAAVFLTVPYQLYLIWSFVKPGLYASERKYAAPFLIMGTVSFVVGLAFGYFFVIPYGYEFLIGFGGTSSQRPLITMTEYFPMTLKMLGAVGLLFELPVVLMLLGALGVVKSKILSTYRRHAYFGLAVAAAVLTPSPDAVTMLIVTVPLCGLYEISIWGVKLVEKKR